MGGLLLGPANAQTPLNMPPRSMVAGDPNLDPNWPFWVDQVPEIYFYSMGQVLNANRDNSLRLPYFTYGTASYNGNPNAADVLPEDGWVLVLRDFGTPASAPPYPHFMLYNKYRGILRLFYLNAQQQKMQQYSATIKFMDSNSALMTFNSKEKCFLKDYDSTLSLTTFGSIPQFGWGHFDFILTGYDPSLSSKPYAAFDVKINAIETSHLSLNGRIEGTIDQVIGSTPPSFSKSDGERAQDALKQGVSYYKAYKDASDGLVATVNNPENKNEWWIGAATTLASSFLTGGTAPMIAGAVGFVSSFIGGGSKQPPMVPMNFKAKLGLEATGSLETTTWLTSPGFHLNYTPNPPSDQRVPLSPIPWGIFNIEEAPEVMVQNEYRSSTRVFYEPDNNPDYYWTIMERYPEHAGWRATVTKNPVVQVNPDTGMTLESIKVATTYQYIKPSPFGFPNSFTYLGPDYPKALSYEIKFKLMNTVGLRHSDPIQLFYKEVPARFVDGSDIGFFEPFVVSRKRFKGVIPN